MDRRGFGKTLVGGATGASLLGGGIFAGTAKAASAGSDAAYRVFPDLPVRRNDKIHSGGDYHSQAGNEFTDQVSLDYFRRFNALHLTCMAHTAAKPTEMSEFPHFGGFLNADGPWDGDQLKRMQDDCRAAGMVLEGVRMDSAYIIMKDGPIREKYLDIIRNNIRKAGAAGATLVSYHWTATPIRRNLTARGRGGATYSGYKLEPDYKDMPPTEAAGILHTDEYWERIDYFLKGVLPACREAKVRLACHPYDPGGQPLGYLGVDQWDAVDYAAALKKYVHLVDDHYNALCYDTGVAGESLPDPNAQLPLLRYLSEKGKIAQVHFRNVRGHQHNFLETYEDEGDVNMFNCLRVLRDTGFEGTLLPDHNPAHPDDPKKLQAFGFSYGYIEGLLRAAKEEALRATKA
jgi:mannonate dehydratase